MLITVLDNETNEKRMSDYLTCLERNLTHPSIDKVHILYNMHKDDGENRLLQQLSYYDVPIIYVDDTPTFGYCFRLANRLYSNRKIIISIGDIYFNRTLKLLAPYNLRNSFCALTRWNATKSGRLHQHYAVRNGRYVPNFRSQDTWIFQTPLPQFEHTRIKIGAQSADGQIAYQAKKSGLRVVNPCMTIQCCRLHSVDEAKRRFDATINQRYPTMPVRWSRLGRKEAKKGKKGTLKN